ncbi:MAG TPA: alpha/beta hydrolase-fold protein [Jatrophihabitans sp.]
MEPNSVLLVILLFSGSIGALVLLVRHQAVVIRVGAGALALLFASVGGMAVVNDYYGYYQSWGQLNADFTGNYGQFTATAIGGRTDPQLTGKVVTLRFAGARSGIVRGGYVYLPPQYFQPAYRHTRFPVAELLHGTPSYAGSWLVHMRANLIADQLISKRLMGPMVLVMPQTYSRGNYSECLNSSHGQDATYLTTDIRHDVVSRFRVSRIPAEWGLIGESSGGYCAANLGLQYRTMFGSIAVMSGYFRPQDGPAAQVLGGNPAAEAANDPLLLARKLSSGVSPLPSFWLASGTANHGDIAGAEAFAAALHGVERTVLLREPGGEHNFYAFGAAFVRALPWTWTQVASPSLRVQFPIAGGVSGHTVRVPSGGRHLPGVLMPPTIAERGHRHESARTVPPTIVWPRVSIKSPKKPSSWEATTSPPR